MNETTLGDELVANIIDRAQQMGRHIHADFNAVRAYAAERLLHLSTIVGEKGYLRAVQAERDNVALKLGIATVTTADATDRELLGTIGGALAIGARALAGGAA